MIKGKTMFALLALAGVTLSTGVAYAIANSSTPIRVSATSNSHAVDLADDFPAMPSAPVFLESNSGGTTVDLRITRNKIMYEITWHGMAPASVRLQGGGTSLAMAPSGLPASITAVEGVIGVSSNRILASIEANPQRFAAGTGMTAPFHKVGAVDFNKILHVGQLVSVDSGDQEVAQSNVSSGDIGAHATVFVGTGTTMLNYAATWTGVTSPTALNINQGGIGAIGNLTASLFKAPHGLDPTIVAVAGSVSASKSAIAALKANPAMFHTNLLTGKFPGGAVRGQLFLATATATTTPPPPTTTTMPMPTTTMQMPTTTKPTMTTKPMPTTKPTAPMPTPTATMPTITVTAGAPPHW